MNIQLLRGIIFLPEASSLAGIALAALLLGCGTSNVDRDGIDALKVAQFYPAAQKLVQEKKDDQALPLYLEFLKGNPTDPSAWFELADLYDRTKRYPEAIDAFEHAKAIGFGYPWSTSVRIAKIYAKQGDKEQAIAWLIKGATEGDRYLLKRKSDATFKDLIGDPRFDDLTGVVDVSKMSRDEGWSYDIKLAARELKRIHASPFHTIPAQDFDATVNKLLADVPSLKDNQLRVGIARMAAMVNDGHTHIGPGMATKALPLKFALFEDGVHITGTDASNNKLLGARVLEIEGKPIAEVFDQVASLRGSENPQWPKVTGCELLGRAWALNGLGVTQDTKEAHLILEQDGARRDVTIPFGDAIYFEDAPLWPDLSPDTSLTYQNHDKHYWDKYLPDSRTHYVQFNMVLDDANNVTLEKFWNRVFDDIENEEVDRLIIDMRWNGGGNSFLNAPLLSRLIKSKVNADKKLYVVTSRYTFSAAVCGVAQIERYTHAIFVGEPIGSSPNFIGEAVPIVLPYSKMEGTISDLFWQNSYAMDHRSWIPVKLYIPWRFEDFKAGRDPAFDAILADK